MFNKINIGIDLGNAEIKIAVIRNLNGIFSLQYKEAYVVNEEIEYFTFLKNCIKDFSKKNKIKKANLSFSIPQNSPLYSIKFFQTPYRESKQIERAVQLDFEKNGDDLEETYLRYGVTTENKDAEEFNILSILIEKKIIESLKKIGDLKWTIVNVEPQIITLGRVVEGNSIVIDMGYENTRMYAFRGGKPVDSRMIEIGEKNLIKVISEQHCDLKGLSVKNKKEKSKKLLKDSCFLTEELKSFFEGNLEASEVIHYEINRLADEVVNVYRSFESYQFNNLDETIENVYLTGGLSEMAYFREVLGNMLNCNMRYIDFLSYENSEEEEKRNHKFTLAGLTSIYNLNDYIKSFNYANISTFKLNHKLIAIGLITITICLQLAMRDINKRHDLILLETEVEIANQQKIISEITHDIQIENNKVTKFQNLKSTIEGINNQKKWFSDILYALPEETPLGIVLTKLQIKDGQVAIEGLSADYTNLGFLAIGLEKYGEVNIEAIKNGINNEIYLNNTSVLDKTFKMKKAFNILFTHNGKILNHEEGLKELKSTEDLNVEEDFIEYIEKEKVEEIEESVVNTPTKLVDNSTKKLIVNTPTKPVDKPTPKLVKEKTVELDVKVEEEVVNMIEETKAEITLEEVLDDIFKITP